MAPPARQWRVIFSADLLAKAKARFPPGGSVDGRPSYELFRDGPLKAASIQFSREIQDLPKLTGLHLAQTVPTPYFAPIDFYAVFSGSDLAEIEIVDFDMNEDYWDLIGDDPVD